MDSNSAFILIGASIAYIIIIYQIIESATKSKTRNDLLYIQIRLLSRLLMEKGVSQDEIKNIIDQGTDSDGDLVARKYGNIIPGMDNKGKIVGIKVLKEV